jgi:type IV pilus assembly protein PilX
MKNNQKGAVLILTLILLTVFLIASVGLIRSVTMNVTAVGNYSYREGALAASDSVLPAVKTYISNKTDLTAADPGIYSPTILANIDASGLPLPCSTGDGWSCLTPVVLSTAYSSTYYIERLCTVAVVTSTGTQCQVEKPTAANGGSYSLRGGNQDGKSLITYPILYRVTVKTAGPKGTLVTTQTTISR